VAVGTGSGITGGTDGLLKKDSETNTDTETTSRVMETKAATGLRRFFILPSGTFGSFGSQPRR
jgi:hypothetical protein